MHLWSTALPTSAERKGEKREREREGWQRVTQSCMRNTLRKILNCLVFLKECKHISKFQSSRAEYLPNKPSLKITIKKLYQNSMIYLFKFIKNIKNKLK